MGSVWDRTIEAVNARAAAVTRIALLTLFLPAVIDAGATALTGEAAGFKPVLAFVNLMVFFATLFGTLALTAVAGDPRTGEHGAYRVATAALPRTIGAVLVIGIVVVLAAVPGLVLLVNAGFDPTAAAAGRTQPPLSPGPALAGSLYLLGYAVLILFVIARLVLLYAVLVNEGRGLGAVRRSLVLTRGLTWRIMGVLILYAIVLWVAWSATQSVFGIVFGLLLGPDRSATAAFMTAIPVAAVLTVLGVLQPIFAARLYAAVREHRSDEAVAA